MAWRVVDDKEMRENMRESMRGRGSYRNGGDGSFRDGYDSGYRKGYEHGYRDHEKDSQEPGRYMEQEEEGNFRRSRYGR